MGVSSDQIGAHGDYDDGARDIDVYFIVARQTSPAGRSAEVALDDASPGQDLEALLMVAATNDLDDEVEVGRPVPELQPIIAVLAN